MTVLFVVISTVFSVMSGFVAVLAFLNGKMARQLKSAKVDVELVRALRAGELDVEDLREAGVLESVRHPSRLPANVRLDQLCAEATRLARNVPHFRRRILRRAPKVRDLQPNEEVWIPGHCIALTDEGHPVVLANHQTSLEQTRCAYMRMRVYHDGSVELGVSRGEDPCIRLDPASFTHKWRRVDRVVDLNSDDIRVFPVDPAQRTFGLGDLVGERNVT